MFEKIKNLFKKKVETEEEIIQVTSYNQLRLRNNETKSMDLSKLPKSTNRKDIQGFNLENLNLEIDIRKLWIPYDTEAVYIHYKSPREVFVHLNHTNLKGNCVIGNLSPLEGIGPQGKYLGIAYYWYSEDTFDETYKEKYPEYFLEKNAPQELKDKYYNPKIIDAVKRKLTEEEKEKDAFLERETLSFKEYCKYYTFLRGKYLGNFKIDKVEKAKIAFVDYFGLEGAKKQLEKLGSIDWSLEELLENLSKIEVSEWKEWLKELTDTYLERKRIKIND